MRLDRGAFRLDGQDVTIGEALAGSLAGGFLAPVLQEIASRRAGAEAARARGLEVDEDALQAAFDAWRQDNDLIAADELERWLEHRDVSVDDVAEFIESRLLCDLLGEVDVELGDEGEPLEPLQLLQWCADDALFGGRLQGIVEGFALRACAPDPAQGTDSRGSEALRWMLGEAGFADEAAFLEAAAVFGVGPERARWALNRESAYRLHQQDVLTQEALRLALAELKEDLRRYELSAATFRDEEVAREVACCVREDRDSFSRAAARAGEPASKTSWFHADLGHAPFGERLASTRVREIVGPQILGDGRARLGQLRAVHEAELGEPQVLGRVEQRLVERSLRRSLQQRVLFPPSQLGGFSAPSR